MYRLQLHKISHKKKEGEKDTESKKIIQHTNVDNLWVLKLWVTYVLQDTFCILKTSKIWANFFNQKKIDIIFCYSQPLY